MKTVLVNCGKLGLLAFLFLSTSGSAKPPAPRPVVTKLENRRAGLKQTLVKDKGNLRGAKGQLGSLLAQKKANRALTQQQTKVARGQNQARLAAARVQNHKLNGSISRATGKVQRIGGNIRTGRATLAKGQLPRRAAVRVRGAVTGNRIALGVAKGNLRGLIQQRKQAGIQARNSTRAVRAVQASNRANARVATKAFNRTVARAAGAVATAHRHVQGDKSALRRNATAIRIARRR